MQIDADPAFQGDYIVLPIIIYLDKTTMDGLRRVSVFPMYVSLANFSWEFYNSREGMELVALLPQPLADPHCPEPGYKPKSDAHRDLKRHFLTGALAIVTNDAREASYTGIEFKDPCGITRKGVPMIFCISKDLGEASAISNVMNNRCDSCLVPRDELHNLAGALAGEYGPRLEPEMRVAINGMLDLKDDPRVARARVIDERTKHGVHPQMVRTASPISTGCTASTAAYASSSRAQSARLGLRSMNGTQARGEFHLFLVAPPFRLFAFRSTCRKLGATFSLLDLLQVLLALVLEAGSG